MSEQRNPGWNPGRVLSALGRIGYRPVSALLDIADNAVSAKASRVAITIETERQSEGRGRPRAAINAFLVADNGVAMDRDGLNNALSLGSSPQEYHEYTLSKFGMGLKSAAASLGRRLEIISRPRSDLNKIYKAVLDHGVIEKTGQYVYELADPSDDDVAALNKVAKTGSGTVIRITSLFHDSLPRASEIIDGLTQRAGVIYNYYLQGVVPHADQLSLWINDELVTPVDPLFAADIDDSSGDLDENSWDGLEPKWIQRPQKIQLDTSGTIFAEVAITQLPHPPSVGRLGDITQAACRERYMIAAGNYGFYVYRNHRLISWADTLGFVPQDQDLYAFRGRFLIDSRADDLLNIDVTKTRIHLSEIANDQLKPLISEAIKKSRIAWQSAHRNTQRVLSQDPHDEANEELDRISKIEERDDKLDEEVAAPDEREQLSQRRKKAIEQKPATEEEKTRLREQKQRVQWVSSLDNNQLWERAHDPTNGLIVRVSQSHRFARDVLTAVEQDANLLKILDILFFSLARGEYDLLYKSAHDSELVEKILSEYRERVGNTLSDLIRSIMVTDFLHND